MSKLLVIVGITGNQGSSVADVFLKDTNYRIRGVSRDPSSAACQALAAKGIEIVQGDVDDVSSLKAAFKHATHIFGNTAFNIAFAMPNSIFDHSKLKPGQSILEWCYELEVQQGKNIADAVATVEGGLEMFIWSSLSDVRKWSKGKYKGVLHFESKVAVVEYIRSTYPEVAKKMSLLQLGIFVTNWKWGKAAVPWEKRPDGSMLLRIPGTGNNPTPFIVPSDTGYFVRALTQVAPGKNLLAFGDRLTWSEYVALWSKVTGVPASFEDSEVVDMDRIAPGGFGEEIGEMFAYAKEFGYDGGDPTVVHAQHLSVEVPVTRIEDYMKSEDWSPLLK